MKFRFCGGLDCPDWVLSQIALLSKLTSIKVRILCSMVVNSILAAEIQEEKAQKAVEDVGFDQSTLKSVLAALAFILTSATKHSCDAQNLSNELQQLGLPSELTAQICKIYEGKRNDIRAQQLETSFKQSAGITEVVAHKTSKTPETKYATLEVTRNGHAEKVAVSEQQLVSLIADLKEARQIADRYKTS